MTGLCQEMKERFIMYILTRSIPENLSVTVRLQRAEE